MVVSPYGRKKISMIRKEIEDAGYFQYEEEIFEIARWSGDAVGKLSRIANLLSILTPNTYRANSRKHRGGAGYSESTWCSVYLERRIPKEGRHFLWKYKWLHICSTTTRYWDCLLGIPLDNLTEEEYNVLTLIRTIQHKYEIPIFKDPYACIMTSIHDRLKSKKDGEILSVPSEEYKHVAEKYASKLGKLPLIQVRG
jgi:hypothetical protein